MILLVIRKNIKYIIVLLLFLVLLLFGRNFTGTDDPVDSRIKQIEKEMDYAKKGIYPIEPKSKPVALNTPAIYKKGDSVRLLYDLESNSKPLSRPFEERPIDISIYLDSDYGDKQLIDNLQVPVPTEINSREVKFTSLFDSSKIIVERNDSRTTGELIISDLKSFRLNVEPFRLDTLNQTIVGKPDLSKITYQTVDSFTGAFPFVFTRKRQLVGQIFSPSTEQISSVDLALAWRGSGGSGNYLVELKEVASDGSYSDPLSHYYFNKNTVQDNFVGGDVYRIPLAANLNKEKRYLISISNLNVRFNLFNTLKIGGSGLQGDAASGTIMTIGDGKEKSVKQLFVKINSFDSSISNSHRVLNGAIIQDVGSGVGIFTYKSSGEPIDFLDLYKSDLGTSFDNIVQGIIAPAKGETSFYYKLDTIHPYAKMDLIFDQNIAGASKNRLFYSFDDKNWLPIDQNQDENLIVEKIVTPSNAQQQTELFVKVTYDHDDAVYKQSQFFGLKSLEVRASLVLNN